MCLPRSRSTWLSVVLNHIQPTSHDRILAGVDCAVNKSSVETWFIPSIAHKRFVVIDRNPADAATAFKKAFNLTRDIEHLFVEARYKMLDEAFKRARPVIKFDDMNSTDAIIDIAYYLTGKELSEEFVNNMKNIKIEPLVTNIFFHPCMVA
jgi:hypothetical protein